MRAVVRRLLLIWATGISGKFSGADLCVSRLFLFRSVTKAPKPASIVLVSLLYAIPFGWCLHDGVVAPYHHQHYGNLWKAN